MVTIQLVNTETNNIILSPIINTGWFGHINVYVSTNVLTFNLYQYRLVPLYKTILLPRWRMNEHGKR